MGPPCRKLEPVRVQKRPRKSASSREKRQRGGEGATREIDTQFRKARAGVCEPMGGWWPRSEVSSFPTRAVLAGDPVGLQAAPAPVAPVLLPPTHSSLGDGSLEPHNDANFCHLPQDGHQPPPGSRPLLLVASEAVVDLQRKRRKNTIGKTDLSPELPEPPASPQPGCLNVWWLEVGGNGDTE